MKKYSKRQIFEAINYWKRYLSLLENTENIVIEKKSYDECVQILDEIDKGHLYTVNNWEPHRIKKTSPENEFYIGYFGNKSPKSVTAIISFEKNNPSTGFIYLDEMTGVKKGYGFETMRCLLKQFPQLKVWWMASPGYDEKTDKYFENTRLNQKYRENFPDMVEYSCMTDIWNCNVSWFYSKNCGNTIKRKIQSKDYF